MCGIAGFIGESTHPKVSYKLLQALLVATEHRGPEATGFWGAQSGDEGQLIYHKEPIKASEFIKRPMWEYLGGFNPSLLIAHCREPTTINGTGHPRVNKNNHPHINSSMNVALIHNGKVEEYQSLKTDAAYRGTTFSECDSEMILRIFERGELLTNEEKILADRYPDLAEKDIAHRIYGIEQIFRKLNNGAMAVAIGERHNPGKRRSLWLFRDDKRPIHIIDLRSSLGQIWFCSTVQIWRNAMEACPEAKALIPKDHKILGIPPLMVYLVETDDDQEDTVPQVNNHNVWKSHWRYRKFKIERKREVGDEPADIVPEQAGINHEPKAPLICVSMLNNNDEVILKMRKYLTEDAEPAKDSKAGRPAFSGEDITDINVKDHETSITEATVVTGGDSGDEDDDLEPGRDSGLVVSSKRKITPIIIEGTDVTDDDTMLEEKEATEVTGDKEDKEPVVVVNFTKKPEEQDPMHYNLAALKEQCSTAAKRLQNIDTIVYNLAKESSLTQEDFKTVLDDVEQINTELASTEFALNKHS